MAFDFKNLFNFKSSNSTPESLLTGKTKKELDVITAPSTNLARNFVGELPKAAYQTALNVLQGTARSGASVALTLTGKDNVSVDESLPKIVKNVFAGIFGDTQAKPLRGFTGIGQETLSGFGAEGLSKNKPLAFALGGTLSALDFTGGGKKKAIQEAGSVISYIKNGKKVFTKLTPAELNILKDEVANIPKAAKGVSQIHLDAITPNLKKAGTEISRAEFISGHPQVASVFKTASEKATKTAIEAENIFFEKNAGKKINGVTIPEGFKAYRRTVTGDTVDIKRLKTDPEYFKQAYESTFARRMGTDEKLYKTLTKELVPKDKEASGYLADLYRANKVSSQAISEASKIPVPSPKPTIAKSLGAELPLNKPQTPQVYESSVNKIINALKEAKPIRKEQEALYSAERAKRVARIAQVGKKVGGEQGYFAQLGQLKGELPKAQFEGIRGKLQQSDIDDLFNQVEKANITPFEKITAKTGLANLIGAEGGRVPTKSELSLLNEIFPKELTEAILSKRSTWEKFKQTAADVINVPRSLMASFDLSAPLRQGIFLSGKPKQFLPAFKEMFKYAFSEKAYEGLIENIKSRPTYQLMRQSKLALTDTKATNLAAREEQFMSNLAERIPGIGKIVRGSDRAYSGFLNKLRADVFDDLVKKSKALGVEQTPKLTDDIAKFVNSATGRGTLPDFAKGAAPLLNGIFFSPRLLASRINLLNPVYYAKLEPFVRKQALKSLLTFGATLGTALGLAKLGGADVVTDPTNSDFAKIKVGNTRYDILGGFQQYIRIASQLIEGKVTSSSSGRTITLGEGYKPLTRKDIALRFFESKESPVASFASALFSGQTALGQDVNVPTEIINRLTPLVVQDMYDLYKEGGLEDLINGLPTPFGVGTQTYGKTELVTGENFLGERTNQVRPVPGLSEAVVEKLFGKQPLGSSKSFDVEQYYDQLIKLPKEQAREIFNDIMQTNPDLAKQISDIVKDREKGITPHDKDLKSKGVASGDRAKAIIKDFNKLKTKEEKRAKWDEYVEKGIITKDVSEQLMKLIKS